MKDEVKVAIIAEDNRLVEFLRPAIAALAHDADIEVCIDPIEKTRGCRPEALRRIALATQADLVTVGVDSDGPTHGMSGLTPRQKKQALIQRLGTALDGAILAIAFPCVEAWLLAEPNAFKQGLEAALGRPFHMPVHWPTPRKERKAKEALGSVVAVGIEGNLPRAGFEYADLIVRKMNLRDSPSESLRAWAREFERRLGEFR